MPDRTRPIRKEICLNEQELNLIQHKMRQLGTHNFGAYARKMLHREEEAGRCRQPCRLEHQPDLPPHQQHRVLL